MNEAHGIMVAKLPEDCNKRIELAKSIICACFLLTHRGGLMRRLVECNPLLEEIKEALFDRSSRPNAASGVQLA